MPDSTGEDAVTEDASEPDGSTDAGAADASTDVPMGGRVCQPTLRLDVAAFPRDGALRSGRLVVVWFQLDDDGPDPVADITYDVEFDPSVPSIEIPMASAGMPSDENLLCDRECDDESICPCLTTPQVGFGIVMVVQDSNDSGSIEPNEVNNENIVGSASAVLGYSAMEFIPAPATPDFWMRKFVDGISAGTCPYRVVESARFDNLGLPFEGDEFILNVCIEGEPCSPPFPNLT